MAILDYFHRFIKSICPTSAQRKETERQVAILKKRLKECINTDGQFYVERIFLSGSVAKHTDLVRRGKGTFDADLGVYFRAQGQKSEQLDKLLSYIFDLLPEIYPEKPVADFDVGKNAVHAYFRTSGLNIDVVPIIRDDSLKRKDGRKLKNSGYIPRRDGWRLTSITAHIHFIHSRTACYKQIGNPVKFNHLVRLVKWWNRRLPENLRQCSYFCELITAAALEGNGVTGEWQSSLERIFGFLTQHGFQKPIFFTDTDYYQTPSAKCLKDLVVVMDAVNPGNNLTRDWDEGIRQGYLKRIQETYKLIRLTRRDEQNGNEKAALAAWCEIFGDEFARCRDGKR